MAMPGVRTLAAEPPEGLAAGGLQTGSFGGYEEADHAEKVVGASSAPFEYLVPDRRPLHEHL
jgi:hypothetical protein